MNSEIGVSCLMMTQPSKKQWVADAIHCFFVQDYPHRELIIGCHAYSWDDDYSDYIADILIAMEGEYSDSLVDGGHISVRVVDIPGDYSLGEGRNRLIEESMYPIIATWDDDDLSAPTRLSTQIAVLDAKNVWCSYLSAYAHMFESEKTIFICEKLNNILDGSVGLKYNPAQVLENSMVAFKDRIKTKYQPLAKGEDTPVTLSILATRKVVIIPDKPELFAYRYVGENAWGARHHRTMVKMSASLARRAPTCWALFNTISQEFSAHTYFVKTHKWETKYVVKIVGGILEILPFLTRWSDNGNGA